MDPLTVRRIAAEIFEAGTLTRECVYSHPWAQSDCEQLHGLCEQWWSRWHDANVTLPTALVEEVYCGGSLAEVAGEHAILRNADLGDSTDTQPEV